MKHKSPEVDAYIEEAAEYARPILKKLRILMHKASPAIEETIKWGVPHFEYRGIVASTAAFKRHVGFGFWNAQRMSDPEGLIAASGKRAAWGLRYTGRADMPPDKVLIRYIKEAVALNEQGVKRPQAPRAEKRELVVPDFFQAALKKNKKALTTFEGFSPSHRKEYIEWISEAKQEATRHKRLETALEWLAHGKEKNWKYRNC